MSVATRADVERLVTQDEFRGTVAELATRKELREAVSELTRRAELREAIAKVATKDDYEKFELRLVALLQQQVNTHLRHLTLVAAAALVVCKGLDFLLA